SSPAHLETQSRLIVALQRLTEEGGLEGVPGLARAPVVINVSQADGKKLADSWAISAADLPLLGIAQISAEGDPGKLLWKRPVNDAAEAVDALLGFLKPGAAAARPLMRAADFGPRNVPLHAGDKLTLTIQGSPGG